MKCEVCKQLRAVYLSDIIGGRVCHRCLQGHANKRLTEWWSKLFRVHPVMCDVSVTRTIAEYLWGNGLDAYCHCGRCNPNWFLRGWICCPLQPRGSLLLNKRTAAALGVAMSYDRGTEMLRLRAAYGELREESAESEATDDDDIVEWDDLHESIGQEMHRRGLCDGVRLLQVHSSRLVIDPSHYVFARIQYRSVTNPGAVIRARQALLRNENWLGFELINLHEGSLAGL